MQKMKINKRILVISGLISLWITMLIDKLFISKLDNKLIDFVLIAGFYYLLAFIFLFIIFLFITVKRGKIKKLKK